MVMVKRAICFLLIGYVLQMACLPSIVGANDWRQQASHQLQQWLQPTVVIDDTGCDGQRFDLRTAVIRFYEHRQYALAWVDRYGLLPVGEMAVAALSQAADQGLRALDYYSPWVEGLLNGRAGVVMISGSKLIEKHIKLDLVLTEMMLRYALHLTTGRTDPIMMAFGEKPPSRTFRELADDLAYNLAAKLDAGHLDTFLEQLGPHHSAYRGLLKSLHRFRKIKTMGGWPAIEEGPTLKRGDLGSRVALLRYRLSISEDIHFAVGFIDDHFDDALKEAVQRFQRRHGLQPDGVVGGKTLAALNVPVDQRIRQIELNLERWRWMPADFGSPHVRVNIPAFKLEVVEAGHVVKTMRTIVGRQRRPTPMLSSMMTYLELNPYWYVPPKIARKDLLPKIQKDPMYLVRQDFRVFDSWQQGAQELNPEVIDWWSLSEDNFPFRLRQEPAARNALGRVKFMFPNDLSVYIHDTPSKSLFVKPSRDFSSGCVRVEEPMALAAFLLGRQNWNQEQLSKVVATNQRRVVVLKEPVPVYLVYFTAWAEADGNAHFREDIYGHDKQLLSTLADSAAEWHGCGTIRSHPNYFVQTGHSGHSNLQAATVKAPL